MNKLKNYTSKQGKKVDKWIEHNYLNVAVFNIILVFLFLLRSAGYFQPFLELTVNFIVMAGLLLAIFLLGARSRALFGVSLFFWIFAGFLKIVKIDVWAERTAIYVYQSMLIGFVILVLESVQKKRKAKQNITKNTIHY